MPVIKKQSRAPKPTPKRSGNLLDSMQSAWDFAESISLLLYGKSGTGKTTLWATFPKPILALIISGGNRPGELRSINTPEYRKSIKPVVINDSSTLSAIISKEAANFATVVMDHGTGLQDLLLKEILGIDELPAQKSWGLASQQQYGQCTQQCKEVFRALLNVEANRVIVAQERSFGDEAGSDMILPYVGAALTPSLTGWLNPACDYVCETFIRPKVVEKSTKIGGKQQTVKIKTREVEYCLRTYPHPVYTVKFRVPKGHELPECIVDPNYESIMAVINGQ